MKNYKSYKHIGALSPTNNGWTKELNFISWENREPVYRYSDFHFTEEQSGK